MRITIEIGGQGVEGMRVIDAIASESKPGIEAAVTAPAATYSFTATNAGPAPGRDATVSGTMVSGVPVTELGTVHNQAGVSAGTAPLTT